VEGNSAGGGAGGGGGGALFGILIAELGRRVDAPGIGGGLPGIGACDSFRPFAAAVTRRFTILAAGRTPKLSETLRGMSGSAAGGLRGVAGAAGVRPSAFGTGGFPEPTIVAGRLGGSTEVGRGAGTFKEVVDVSGSAATS
jgi:hypothetical protein